MGSTVFPLSAQIADTVRTHGYAWASWHYCCNRRGPKLSAFEWSVLSRGV